MDIFGWLRNLLSASDLLSSFGSWVLVGMGIVVFIESGLLFPFLPGDSLLVTATILRASLGISVWQILVVAAIAAVAGDQAGFWLGRRFGRRLFTPNARILRTDRIEAAEAFFERRGPLALVLGRFVPIVRTYIPVVAGTARMSYRHFVVWNVLGALSWVGSMTLVGLLLGGIPGIAHSIEGIMLVVVAVSLAPIAVSALRRRRGAGAAEAAAVAGVRGAAAEAEVSEVSGAAEVVEVVEEQVVPAGESEGTGASAGAPGAGSTAAGASGAQRQ